MPDKDISAGQDVPAADMQETSAQQADAIASTQAEPSQFSPHKSDSKNLKREYNVGKHIASTAAKTLLACVFVLFVVILSVYVINPLAMANFCGNLGFKNAEVSCLELVYTRNKTDANLYNLILKLGNVNNPAKQNDYILKLQNSQSYAKFCQSVDKSTLQANANGDLSVRNLCYIYGTSEYLNGSYVNNLISLNKLDDAYASAVKYWQAEQESLTDCTIYSYVQTLQTTKVSVLNREKYCKQLLAEDSFASLQTKKDAIEALDQSDMPKGQIALYRYAKLKITYVQYMVYANSGEEYSQQAEAQKDAYTASFVDWQASLK